MMTINQFIKHVESWCRKHYSSFNGVLLVQKSVSPAPIGAMKMLSMKLWYVKADRTKRLICETEGMELYSEQDKDTAWEKIERKFVPVVLETIFRK